MVLQKLFIIIVLLYAIVFLGMSVGWRRTEDKSRSWL